MKKKLTAAALSAGLTLVFVGIANAGENAALDNGAQKQRQHRQHRHAAAADSPAAHHHETSADAYTCPMHPNVKEEKPGQCPICGMDLVKAQAARKRD